MEIVAWYLPYLMDIDDELNKSEDFFRVFESASDVIDNTTGDDTMDPSKSKGAIKITNVDFCYPKKPAIKILKKINCDIKAG